MTAPKRKLHPCNARVDALLREKNTRLVVGLFQPDVAVLRTEIVTPGRGRRACAMIASYCPFCGKKYAGTSLHPAQITPITQTKRKKA